MTDTDQGRRALDNAHVVKWVPVVSMLFAMVIQTVFVVRFVSGLEAQVLRLNEGYGEVKVEVKALASATAQGAVPFAINQRRLEELERKSSEHERRLSAMEAVTGVKAR